MKSFSMCISIIPSSISRTRIKTPESIVKKLKRYGYETSIENMVRYVNDIAGVRVICSFTSDIYRLAEMIGNQSDLKVLSIKTISGIRRRADTKVTRHACVCADLSVGQCGRYKG